MRNKVRGKRRKSQRPRADKIRRTRKREEQIEEARKGVGEKAERLRERAEKEASEPGCAEDREGLGNATRLALFFRALHGGACVRCPVPAVAEGRLFRASRPLPCKHSSTTSGPTRGQMDRTDRTSGLRREQPVFPAAATLPGACAPGCLAPSRPGRNCRAPGGAQGRPQPPAAPPPRSARPGPGPLRSSPAPLLSQGALTWTASAWRRACRPPRLARSW